MSKFVTINYYPYFSQRNTTTCYGDGDIDKPFTITLNIDSIMSIGDKPRSLNTYMSYKDRDSGEYALKNVHLLNTNAGVGLGLNGVDFKSYFITEESYRKLIVALDPLPCV